MARKGACVAMAAMALTGCSDNEPATFYDGSGQLAIALQIEPVMVSGALIPTPEPSLFALTLEAKGNGATHSWPSFSNFKQGERYLSGSYTATATRGSYLEEGFGAEFYQGMVDFQVGEGDITEVEIPVRLKSALVSVGMSPELEADYPDVRIILQAQGGTPVAYAPAETRMGALRPGKAFVAVGLGHETMFMMPEKFTFESATHYHLEAIYDSESKVLEIQDGEGRKTSVALTPEALSSAPPGIRLEGASDGEPLAVIERTPHDAPLMFEIIDAEAATLNISSETLSAAGAPNSINLLDPEPADAAWMQENGVAVTRSGSTVVVDLRELPRFMVYSPAATTNVTRLSVVAVNRYNRLSQSPILDLEVIRATMEVVEVQPALVGRNQSEVTVHSLLSLEQLQEGLSVAAQDGSEAAIRSITAASAPGEYLIDVEVAPGLEPVDLDFLYKGERVAYVEIPRGAPEYEMAVDAFAKRAWVKISASTPALVAYITNHLSISVGGAPARIQGRHPREGTIEIIGLQPHTSYTLSASLLTDSDGNSEHQASFTTEGAPQLPNGDFEEAKDRIDWHDLPAGGVYSQTQVAVYSQQNRTSYNLKAPEKWANTNAKTFFTGSENLNTWYMQPSVWTTETPISGDRAVRLVSVAFDPHGPEIPPYRQESQPFTAYSRNIPDIAYRAAGKIFLGSYSYSPAGPTETYTEGIDFRSRPTSLNGWYRYVPSVADPSDTGVALIEVLGMTADGESVIASGRTLLPLATDYTAFTVPLDYSGSFAVKATRIRVMISSSASVGDIPFESVNVKTYPDPASSSSTGSVLDLDNLTLAY